MYVVDRDSDEGLLWGYKGERALCVCVCVFVLCVYVSVSVSVCLSVCLCVSVCARRLAATGKVNNRRDFFLSSGNPD